MGKFFALFAAFALSSCAAAPVYASPCDGLATPLRALFRCASAAPAPLVVKAPAHPVAVKRAVPHPKPRPVVAPVAAPEPVAAPVVLPPVVPLDAPAAAVTPKPKGHSVMLQTVENIWHGLSWSAIALIVLVAWYAWRHGIPSTLAAVQGLWDKIQAFRTKAVADVKGAQTALVDEFTALKNRVEAVEVAVGLAKPAAPAPAEPPKPAA